VLAAIVGVSMITWWLNFPSRDRRVGWRLYYAGFGVIFALMVALRFTAR
jgi:hypothetical protein